MWIKQLEPPWRNQQNEKYSHRWCILLEISVVWFKRDDNDFEMVNFPHLDGDVIRKFISILCRFFRTT